MWIINELTLNKALKNGTDNAYIIQDYNPYFYGWKRFALIHLNTWQNLRCKCSYRCHKKTNFENLGSSRHMWLRDGSAIYGYSVWSIPLYVVKSISCTGICKWVVEVSRLKWSKTPMPSLSQFLVMRLFGK